MATFVKGLCILNAIQEYSGVQSVYTEPFGEQQASIDTYGPFHYSAFTQIHFHFPSTSYSVANIFFISRVVPFGAHKTKLQPSRIIKLNFESWGGIY